MSVRYYADVNVDYTSQAPPSNALGAFVYLGGAGGAGGRGHATGAAARGGGGGGGGGAKAPWLWIPIADFSSTYSVSRGLGGSAGVIGGTAQSNGGDSVFSTGTKEIRAGGGAAGGNGSTTSVGAGGAGGTCTYTNITGTGYSGGAGGAGGNYVTNSNATGVAGSNGSNGSGAGGGGGGGLDASGNTASWTTSFGAKGGDGELPGGAQTNATTVTNNGATSLMPDQSGGGGSGGALSSGYTANPGGAGGLMSGGGGSTGTNGTQKLGGAGGNGFTVVVWAIDESSTDFLREFVAIGDSRDRSSFNLSWEHISGGGTQTCVLIDVTVNSSTGGGLNTTSLAVTYDGSPAMMLAQNDIGNGRGAIFTYIVWNPPSGAKNIAVTVTGGGTIEATSGSSVSYTQVGGIGTVHGFQIDAGTATSQEFWFTSTTGRKVLFFGGLSNTWSSGTLNSQAGTPTLLFNTQTLSRTAMIAEVDGHASPTLKYFYFTSAAAYPGGIALEIIPASEDATQDNPYIRSISKGNRNTGSSTTLSTNWTHELDVSDANTLLVVMVSVSVSSNSADTTVACDWGGTSIVDGGSGQLMYSQLLGSSTDRNATFIFAMFNPGAGTKTVTVTCGGASTKASIIGQSYVYHNVAQITVGANSAATLGLSGSGVAQQCRFLAMTTNGTALSYSDPADSYEWITHYRGGGAVSGAGDYMGVMEQNVPAVGTSYIQYQFGGSAFVPNKIYAWITGKQWVLSSMVDTLQKMAFSGNSSQSYLANLAAALKKAAFSGLSGQEQAGAMQAVLKPARAVFSSEQGFPGTVVATMKKPSFNGSGGHEDTGQLGASIQKLAFTGSGGQKHTGAVAATMKKMIANYQASQEYQGQMASVMKPHTMTASGSPIFDGNLGASLKKLTFTATGQQPYSGAIATAIKPLTFTGTGEHPFTGVMTASMQKMSTMMNSNLMAYGDMIGTMKKPTFTGSGGQTHTGTITASIQKLAFAGTGGSSFGNIAATLPKLQATLTSVNVSGTITARLPKLAASFTANTNPPGQIASRMQKLIADFAGIHGKLTTGDFFAFFTNKL